MGHSQLLESLMECETDYIHRTIDDHIDTVEGFGFI
jgi:hypothetical protein